MRPRLLPFLSLAACTAAANPTGSPGFAVVELFTSEGCSSCPPADRLLADLASEAEREGHPVFTLSFHVDYWNHLGWADPFSQASFTERQRRYADILGGGVYTPEMVVNGSQGFVGSQSGTARAAVRNGLTRAADCQVRIDSVSADPKGNLSVTYAAKGCGTGALLNLALVEKDLSVPVGRGENGGRTLKHHNVVRAFRTIRLDAQATGNSRLSPPADAPSGKVGVIAYVQDAESFAIKGAAHADIMP